jgi:hypothetical protein
VIDTSDQALLQQIVRREGRSFLQYIGQAFPWTPPGQESEVTAIRTMAAEEQDELTDLVRFMTKNRITPPYLGAYPTAFTSMNFTAIDFLLPVLIQTEHDGIKALEADTARLADLDARGEVAALLDKKKRHLDDLTGLAAAGNARSVA